MSVRFKTYCFKDLEPLTDLNSCMIIKSVLWLRLVAQNLKLANFFRILALVYQCLSTIASKFIELERKSNICMAFNLGYWNWWCLCQSNNIAK